ncbi:hypothetical protein ABIB40_000285 [Pedobacter sp. UYP30]|uniref:hypothetical protein n=1 Tax=Pedobacter sp. UYP30 TaxID=1756400 RepID=UPI0033918ED9
MQKILFTTLTVLSFLNALAQKKEKVFLDKTDSTRNCYTILYPAEFPLKGYLVIIPGFGETAESVLQQTGLPILAAQSRLLTIIPTFQEGRLSFGIDNLSQESLKSILQDVRKKHGLKNEKLFIGGFSIGGSCAIKFAEETDLKPTAIFAIDPTLDFERFFISASRDIILTTDGSYNQENVFMVDNIKKLMGGEPQDVPENYYKISPYSYSDTSQTAIKKIVDFPIIIYCEPDVQWWLKNRNADFSNMNVLDCSAMINELRRLGNKNAILVTTENKGYREPNHQRHPHSWSIVDNRELISWLLQIK